MPKARAGDPAEPSAAVTPDRPSPTRPPVVTRRSASNGAALVSWTAAADNGSRDHGLPGDRPTRRCHGTTTGLVIPPHWPISPARLRASRTAPPTTVTVCASNANGERGRRPHHRHAPQRQQLRPPHPHPHLRHQGRLSRVPAPGLAPLHAMTFQVTGQYPGDPTRNVPANATAVTGVLSVSGCSSAGYLSLTPEPVDHPTTSNLNFPAKDSRAAGVTVTLGTGGTLSVTYAPGPAGVAQVAFDVTGYFLEGTSGSTYFSLAPRRVFDSRTGLGPARRHPGQVRQRRPPDPHRGGWLQRHPDRRHSGRGQRDIDQPVECGQADRRPRSRGCSGDGHCLRPQVHEHQQGQPSHRHHHQARGWRDSRLLCGTALPAPRRISWWT